MKHETREAWLSAALEKVRAHLSTRAQMILPLNCRVSVGFPGGRGKTNKAIGQCWPSNLSGDKSHEMFISPVLDEPSRVLDVLIHEAIHAADDNKSGHKGAFRRAAIAAGLEGKMTATVASEALKPILKDWSDSLGPYPHAKLDLNSPLRIRQGTRMLKCSCPDCGYTVRTTAKWIDIGLPVCPCGTEMEAPS
jgi:hypothetical protein